MAKGLIKEGFYDKHTGLYNAPGTIVEFGDLRLKELVALGYVESRENLVKSEEKPEVKPEPEKKPTAKKTTTKKK